MAWMKPLFSIRRISGKRNSVMDMQTSIHQLAGEIRQLYQADIPRAEALIEAHLEKRMKGIPSESRPALINKLLTEFNADSSEMSGREDMDSDVLARVFSLMLGREVSQDDLSSSEVLQRLAASINTVFDSLNQLIRVINLTLSTGNSGDETIRYVIGSQLEGGGNSISLESYLGQIQKSFLTTQQAFKNAAFIRVKEILSELDPEIIAASAGGGMKFGPLRKAEYFEIYTKKYQTCKKWFESGRFMDAFIQEFENSCQKLTA